MTDRREADIRKWIQEVAATSQPVQIEDVLNWGSIDVDPLTPDDAAHSEPPFLYELKQENPMTNKRNLYLAFVAAAAAIVVVAFAVTNGTDTNTGIAEQVDLPTATTPTVVAADVATEFWLALAAGDREQALALVDPSKVNLGAIVPHGRAGTLEGAFDWWKAVGWKWQLAECVEFVDEQVKCMASGGNAWSEALGVEPVRGSFLIRFSEDGITAVEDEALSFRAIWSTRVFEKFALWAAEFHPDDAAIMFENVDVNQEILDLYELNTARFVEAQQAE